MLPIHISSLPIELRLGRRNSVFRLSSQTNWSIFSMKLYWGYPKKWSQHVVFLLRNYILHNMSKCHQNQMRIVGGVWKNKSVLEALQDSMFKQNMSMAWLYCVTLIRLHFNIVQSINRLLNGGNWALRQRKLSRSLTSNFETTKIKRLNICTITIS